jgi:DNA-binding CsgD family transcriptional regulator
MRTNPALVAIDDAQDTSSLRADEVIRTIIELIDRTVAESALGPSGPASEEILVDTEVDGFRYLLIRMPARNRIHLSPREQEIVRMVAKGHPNKVIADVLNISSWTVCTHLRRIFAKLGVGSRAAMVAQLLEIGTLPNDHPKSEGLKKEEARIS